MVEDFQIKIVPNLIKMAPDSYNGNLQLGTLFMVKCLISEEEMLIRLLTA